MTRASLIPVMVLTLLSVVSSAYAEMGTCLTNTGLLVAPWSDAADPACGEDCGAEGVVLEFPDPELLDPLADDTDGLTPCDDEDVGLCTFEEPEGRGDAELAPEDDEGPRCDHEGPECQRRAPTPGASPDLASGASSLTDTSALPLGIRLPPGQLPEANGFPAPRTLRSHIDAPSSPPPRHT